MATCPNCGFDRADAKRIVAVSAKDLVEGLQIDADLTDWIARLREQNDGALLFNPQVELDAFKDRMRTSGYKTNAGPVKDARAAFRTHMRNAVLYAAKRSGGSAPSKATRNVMPKKEL